jgi:hypothetical protein
VVQSIGAEVLNEMNRTGRVPMAGDGETVVQVKVDILGDLIPRDRLATKEEAVQHPRGVAAPAYPWE